MIDPTPQTPPQGLTDEQLLELAAAALGYTSICCSDEDYSGAYEAYGSELLAFGREAIAAHEAARAQLPPGYIDDGHTDEDRKLLEAFYVASRAEGGTADEIVLRGIRAAISSHEASLLRDGTKMALTPEEVEARFRAWWAESYPNAPAGAHAVQSHVAFALHLLGGEVAA